MDEHDFFDDPDAHDTRHHPFTSPGRFRQAFDWYMAGIGMRHEPVVAAAVFSAFTLVDPAGVLFLGENPDPASEYSGIQQRVWFEVCRGIRRGGVTVEEVMSIVVDALVADFDEEYVFHRAPDVRRTAELIATTVSAFPATCHDVD